jgi:2-polyprenyl-3-methyl-5-hydroxy-6-metoxy-1,4-benzoquinol methylase
MVQVIARYDPEVFAVGTDLQEAKNIILTEEGTGYYPDERWERETPYLTDLITEKCGITERTTVLDYGCGIGRLAKTLIDRTGCFVVGTDISYDMLALAVRYVASPRFVATPPNALDLFYQFDVAISVWVLQHVINLKEEGSPSQQCPYP